MRERRSLCRLARLLGVGLASTSVLLGPARARATAEEDDNRPQFFAGAAVVVALEVLPVVGQFQTDEAGVEPGWIAVQMSSGLIHLATAVAADDGEYKTPALATSAVLGILWTGLATGNGLLRAEGAPAPGDVQVLGWVESGGGFAAARIRF